MRQLIYRNALLGIVFLVSITGNAFGVYLSTSFRDDAYDGLHLAYSNDGYNWSALNNDESFLTPYVGGKMMRDTSVVCGSDGTYHMVWTCGKESFGYSSTTDFVHWSPQKFIEVSDSIPNAQNTWAPELFYDQGREEFLIVWATSDDELNEHRLYSTTTTNFNTFTPTQKFFDPGYSVIDGVIIQEGSEYTLVFKDERGGHKCLKTVTANDITPGSFDSQPISNVLPTRIDYVEGPSAVKIGNDYYVYYDHYTYRFPYGQYYGALKSSDLVNWTDVSRSMSFPNDTRHGTVLEVPLSVVENLQQTHVQTRSLDNGDFESITGGAFTSWVHRGNYLGNPVATRVTTSQGISARVEHGENEGGKLYQKISVDQLTEYAWECDFAVLPIDSNDYRSFCFWSYASDNATTTIVDSIRVNSDNHIMHCIGDDWVDTGLIVDVTTDTGMQFEFDGETPVFNHLEFLGTGYTTDDQAVMITLNGDSYTGQGAVNNSPIQAIAFVGYNCATDFIVDNVVLESDSFAGNGAVSDVPEPATTTLLVLLGLLVFGWRVCRRERH